MTGDLERRRPGPDGAARAWPPLADEQGLALLRRRARPRPSRCSALRPPRPRRAARAGTRRDAAAASCAASCAVPARRAGPAAPVSLAERLAAMPDGRAARRSSLELVRGRSPPCSGHARAEAIDPSGAVQGARLRLAHRGRAAQPARRRHRPAAARDLVFDHPTPGGAGRRYLRDGAGAGAADGAQPALRRAGRMLGRPRWPRSPERRGLRAPGWPTRLPTLLAAARRDGSAGRPTSVDRRDDSTPRRTTRCSPLIDQQLRSSPESGRGDDRRANEDKLREYLQARHRSTCGQTRQRLGDAEPQPRADRDRRHGLPLPRRRQLARGPLGPGRRPAATRSPTFPADRGWDLDAPLRPRPRPPRHHLRPRRRLPRRRRRLRRRLLRHQPARGAGDGPPAAAAAGSRLGGARGRRHRPGRPATAAAPASSSARSSSDYGWRGPRSAEARRAPRHRRHGQRRLRPHRLHARPRGPGGHASTPPAPRRWWRCTSPARRCAMASARWRWPAARRCSPPPACSSSSAASAALAPDGRCKAFADGADGTGFSEGVGVLVLERLSDAAAQRPPRSSPTIRGSRGQPGRRLQRPHRAQRPLPGAGDPRRPWPTPGLTAADVDVVEAHGTGTALGDPIEARRPARHLRPGARGRPLRLGSIKSNIGHTQAAAGVGGVIKMVMAMRDGRAAEDAARRRALAARRLGGGRGRAADRGRSSGTPSGRPRRAGVSSFGISGTNAHLILEEAPASRATERRAANGCRGRRPADPARPDPARPLGQVRAGPAGPGRRAWIAHCRRAPSSTPSTSPTPWPRPALLRAARGGARRGSRAAARRPGGPSTRRGGRRTSSAAVARASAGPSSSSRVTARSGRHGAELSAPRRSSPARWRPARRRWPRTSIGRCMTSCAARTPAGSSASTSSSRPSSPVMVSLARLWQRAA